MILPSIPTPGKRPRSACRSVPVPCIIRKPLSLSAFSDGPPKHPEQPDRRRRSAHGVEMSTRRRYRKNTLPAPCILRGHPSPHESPDRRSGVPCLLKQPCAPRTMLRQRARFACPGGFCPIESARPRRCVPFIARLPKYPCSLPRARLPGNPCSLPYTRLPG